MKYLVVSTLPHYCACIPLLNPRMVLYIGVICVSSTFSVLYHLYQESNTVITVLDYCMAGIWVIYDLRMINPNAKKMYLYLTFILFCINVCIPYNEYYPMYHSGWHLLNAGKCLYTTRLVERRSKVVSV